MIKYNKLKNLTTADVVRVLGCSRTTAWRILKGNTSIGIEEAYMLAQFTNTDLDVVIKYYSELRKKTKEEK